ncbi:Probable outer membrane protein PmpB (Polymorphic membrane protein B) [Durusdinium trenchii]|uniref:Probable outer membrane protein PmpB (Polymorphic membrane protein B) n=1 Tax=Durusdinium trenchii TaxID=1381693 RepID=A0ABP0SE70_9DINO
MFSFVWKDCEAISWADLCERQLTSGECFQLQPGTSPAMRCQLRGPASAHAPLRPAQLRAAAQGVVTTCGTPGELRITGTMLLEDAQVEAWHEAPDLSIEAGGAFHSKGPLTLTRSTLTDFGFIKPSSAECCSSRVWRLRQHSKVFMQNVYALKGHGGGFFVVGGANITESGLIHIKNARSARGGGGFLATQRLQLTRHSTVSIQHATAAEFGGGFIALDDVVIDGRSNVTVSDAVAAQGGGFQVEKRLQVTRNSTLNLQNLQAGSGGGFNALGEVQIGGSSTVKLSNCQAVSGDGGGFSAAKELRVSSGSTLLILNATGKSGGGFHADGKVAISNSTLSIQHAAAAGYGGGFVAQHKLMIADMSNLSISDALAQKGGGFYVVGGLQVTSKSTLNLQDVKAGRNGGGFLSHGEVEIGGSSTVKISNSQAISEDGGGFEAH